MTGQEWIGFYITGFLPLTTNHSLTTYHKQNIPRESDSNVISLEVYISTINYDKCYTHQIMNQ